MIRILLQTAGAYIAAALAIWGAMDLAVDAFSLPQPVLRLVMESSAIGLPIALAVTYIMIWRIRNSAGHDGLEHSGAHWIGLAAGTVSALAMFLAFYAANPPDDQATKPASTELAAIAVLPFDNLTEQGGNEHFAAGFADDIVTSLQSWGVFPVIGRSSTQPFQDTDMTATQLAAELGVRYLLDGSVRTSGTNIRINARLLDGGNSTQVWAGRFERNTSDLFQIQDEITEEIVTAIAPEMVRSATRRADVEHPADLATWELVMQAQALVVRGNYDDTVEGRRLLELAVSREPGYAVAYTRLAEVGHNISTSFGAPVGDDAASLALAEALEFAREAVRLNPLLVDARIWLGHLLLHHREIDAGLEQLEEAVRLSPSHGGAHAELAFGYATAGKVDAALRELELSTRLSRNDPRNARIRTFGAFAYFYSEMYAEAAQTAREIIDDEKGSALNVFPYVVEISSLVRLGNIDQAKQSAAEFESLLGPIDWPAIERGAWSEAQIQEIRSNLVTIGMLAP